MRVKHLIESHFSCSAAALLCSSFSQAHRVGNIGITANFVFIYLQFHSLFALYDVSRCEIRGQWA